MNFRFVTLLASLGVASCTENFDQYTFGGAGGAGASGAGAAGADGGGGSGGTQSGGGGTGGVGSGGAASGGAPQGGGPSSGGSGGSGGEGGEGGEGGNGGDGFSLPCGNQSTPELACEGPAQQCCDKDNGMVSCAEAGSGCSGNNIEIQCRVTEDCGPQLVCCAALTPTGNAGKVECVPQAECAEMKRVMCVEGEACAVGTCAPVPTMPDGYFACDKQ